MEESSRKLLRIRSRVVEGREKKGEKKARRGRERNVASRGLSRVIRGYSREEKEIRVHYAIIAPFAARGEMHSKGTDRRQLMSRDGFLTENARKTRVQTGPPPPAGASGDP